MMYTEAPGGLGVRLARVVARLMRLHRYPRYIIDLSATYVLPYCPKKKGLLLGRGSRFIGFPIIALPAGAQIAIGRNCCFISRSANTAMGVSHPMILRVMRPDGKLVIGCAVRMSGTTICAAERITVGDRTVIGANATLVDTDFHSLDPGIRCSAEDASAAATAPVCVGRDVFIGAGAFILKGVTIGDAAVIGAASVVTKNVPPGAIVAGNPARQIGSVADVCGRRGFTIADT
jgi:acetyltransferase-like isoleucine patch superfamily enzyme